MRSAEETIDEMIEGCHRGRIEWWLGITWRSQSCTGARFTHERPATLKTESSPFGLTQV